MPEGEVKTSSERLEAARRKERELEERYSAFADELSKEGALSYKVKQLIALAISVVKDCEYCMRAHALHALEAGATGEEVVEACFMAVQMDGGPSLVTTREQVLKVVEDYENGTRYYSPYECKTCQPGDPSCQLGDPSV